MRLESCDPDDYLAVVRRSIPTAANDKEYVNANQANRIGHRLDERDGAGARSARHAYGATHRTPLHRNRIARAEGAAQCEACDDPGLWTGLRALTSAQSPSLADEWSQPSGWLFRF